MNEFLKGILDGINSIIGNYGWSVVVFTLLIRLVIMPFDYKSRRGMRKMSKLQPQVTVLQKKYANDKEKLNKKLSELYQKEKVNPLSSCLPMLLTMPILFAMFAAMRMVAGEHMAAQVFDILQGNEPVMESWLWINNIWMPDSPFAAAWPDLNNLRMVEAGHWLTAFNALTPETVASLPIALTADSFSSANLQATLQLINTQLQSMPNYVEATAKLPGWSFNLWIAQLDVMVHYNGFFILPILSALSQMLMTKVQPMPSTEGQDGQKQSTGAFMKWFFPLFSLFICSSYNAIFAIYWVAANVIATVQNVFINKYLDMKEKQENVVEGTVK